MKITGPGIVPEVNRDIPPINPNDKVGLPVKFKFETVSNYNCKIIVDSTNTNDESIENNNEITLIARITE